MPADEGRWIDEPPLPPLTPPPPHLIAVRGAQLLYVLNLDAHNPASRGGHTETVALAWARTPDGDWVVLLAWLGGWQQDGRTTGRGILEDRVRVMPVVRRAGVSWYGMYEPNELGAAIQRAALTLPGHLREAALTPLEGESTEEP